MSTRPNKSQWSKSFVLIDQRAIFQTIPSTKLSPKTTENTEKRSEINVPSFELIQENSEATSIIGDASSRSSIPLHYIRATAESTLPKPYSYSLTEADLEFLQAINRSNQGVISEFILEKSLAFLEKKIGRGCPQLNCESFRDLKEYLEILLRGQTEKHQLNQTLNCSKQIWKYWMKRRQQLDRPLLREFLRPDRDNPDGHLAFRKRKKINDTQQPVSRTEQIFQLKKSIVKTVEQIRSLKIIEAMSAAIRIREVNEMQQIRQQFAGWNHYIQLATNIKATQQFDEPYKNVDLITIHYQQTLKQSAPRYQKSKYNNYEGNGLSTIDLLWSLLNVGMDLQYSSEHRKSGSRKQLRRQIMTKGEFDKIERTLQELNFQLPVINDKQRRRTLKKSEEVVIETTDRGKMERIIQREQEITEKCDNIASISQFHGVSLQKPGSTKRKRNLQYEHLLITSEEKNRKTTRMQKRNKQEN